MKKSIFTLFLFVISLFYSTSFAQVSPDYIFGNDNGNSWNWTTGTAGTASINGTYKWQFQSTTTGNQFFKFGESSSSTDGSGFWMNSSESDLLYTGNGTMWNAYYFANMGGKGAVYFPITTGNYYVVKSRKDPSISNCNFAIFNNGTTPPVSISSLAHSYSDPNLLINVTISGNKGSTEKIWIRYTTDRWATSSTIEASTDLGSNVWQSSIAYADGKIIEYYAYSTIDQNTAPAENDADFYTVSYLNNSGNNYKFARFTGSYYIGENGTGPSGSNPNFSTLKSACDLLNNSSIIGNVNLYITSNITESQNFGLGVNTNSYTIKILPSADADRTISFTQSTDNTALSGGFIIGIKNVNDWNTLIPTNNIIIDGYAESGSTRRLTWKTTNAALYTCNPIIIVGNNNNIIVKNSNIIHEGKVSLGGNNVYGVGIRLRNVSSNNYVPTNITIENCDITVTTATLGNGISVFSSTSPTVNVTGLVIKDNAISSSNSGIMFYYCDSPIISGNTISVNQTSADYMSCGIVGMGYNTGSIVVANNKLISLKTGATTGTNAFNNDGYGIRGIQASGGGTWYISNNFITGFVTPASGSAEVVGITASVPSKIYYNTIQIDNLSNAGPGYTPTSGIAINTFATSSELVNNIIITNEDDYVNYCIYGYILPSTSNYNNLYRSGTTNAKIGYYGGAQATLSDWRTATSRDANSISKNVSFKSYSDLHLTYFSQGDFDLAGTPLAEVTTDIDGNSRSSTYPYMGADENVNVSLAPYKKNVDGIGTDWTGTAPSTLHATTVSNAEAIYTGENGDCRTEQHAGDLGNEYNNDLNEVRYTRDDNYLYFMFKLKDLFDLNKPYIAITLDSDQAVGDNSPVWIGDNSYVDLNPSTNNGWERQIAIHTTSNNNFNIELYAEDGTGNSWYVPLSNYAIAHSVDNNIIEARIALYDLAINSNSNVNFAFATFDNVIGYNNSVDATTGSYIDVVTPGYSGTNNAWFRAGENTTLISNYGWLQSLTPLPVELSSFTASTTGSSVSLTWSTATEINAYSFEIERSGDNNNWSHVGTVSAHGNSSSINDYEYLDELTNSGKYYYRLKQIDNDGAFEYSNVIEVNVGTPESYCLSQNYPNPFNPTTTINYSLPLDSRVTINIYSITGELVRTLVNEDKSAGSYSVELNASDLASGTYFYRLIANDFVQTKKMLLIK